MNRYEQISGATDVQTVMEGAAELLKIAELAKHVTDNAEFGTLVTKRNYHDDIAELSYAVRKLFTDAGAACPVCGCRKDEVWHTLCTACWNTVSEGKRVELHSAWKNRPNHPRTDALRQAIVDDLRVALKDNQ